MKLLRCILMSVSPFKSTGNIVTITICYCAAGPHSSSWHKNIQKIYKICHELTIEITFYQTSLEKCY